VTPEISIVIPAYQHAAYIGETLASIAAQPFRALEVIVVDDGSTDGTAETARAAAEGFPFPITVIEQANCGTCVAINRGLAVARGEFFAMIASDDVFAPDRFSAQLAVFRNQPDCEVVYGNGRYWQAGTLRERVHDAQLVALLRQPPAAIHAALCQRDYPMFIQTALFRTATLREVGGFDEITGVDDWPLNIRLFRRFTDAKQYAYVDVDVVWYRQHARQQYRDPFIWPARKVRVIETWCPPEWRNEALAYQYWQAGRELLYRSLALSPSWRRVLRLWASLADKCRKAKRTQAT
jgi:glycosyltransferase involved in cell wall biosynthesis